ncbi:hypothetical protein B23_1299 [Geobacillus thermoleovorans B23]|nr:hypothetical protein B23_1299 [Geobacillus thermoleovorans B23]
MIFSNKGLCGRRRKNRRTAGFSVWTWKREFWQSDG